MARQPTTTDAFNAIAEPQRRRILELLSQKECSVNEIAEALHLRQPQASTHLGVLKKVGLVKVRVAAQQRLYQLNGEQLRPVYDWLKTFERFWEESFDRLGNYLKEMQRQEKEDQPNDN